jgi:hypothetical protein
MRHVQRWLGSRVIKEHTVHNIEYFAMRLCFRPSDKCGMAVTSQIAAINSQSFSLAGIDATFRSHLSHSTWKVTRPSTAAECELLVTAPTCYPGKFPTPPTSNSNSWSQNVVCDTNSMPSGSQWPLVSPTADPVMKTAAVPASVCGDNKPRSDS